MTKIFTIVFIATGVGAATILLIAAFHALTLGLQENWAFHGYLGFAILILSAVVIPVGLGVIYNLIKSTTVAERSG